MLTVVKGSIPPTPSCRSNSDLIANIRIREQILICNAPVSAFSPQF